MNSGARPGGQGRTAWGTVLVSAFAAAAWAQQIQIPVERFPGMKLDAPSGAGALCKVCGEIRSIREIHVGLASGSATPNPSAQQSSEPWQVVGNVLSVPFGPGSDGTRVGTAGTPEMNARFAESSFEIAIRMDDGERRTLQRRDGRKFRVGDRVAMRSGELELMVPR
jgi:hypothetical protein